jgi:corrinoid protein of di/trimethylamine methyltransferase
MNNRFSSKINSKEAKTMSDRAAIMQQLYDAVLEGDSDKSTAAAQKAIDAAINPVDAINDGLTPGIREVGDRFGRMEIFLPQMVNAASAMEAAVKVLEPHFPGGEAEKKGKVMICTVAGDIHDIGKNIVTVLLKVNGFEVYDIGRDIPNVDVIDKAEELGVDVIALSGLLTTSLPMMRDIISMMEQDNVRSKFKVIIGGGPTSQEFADDITADGYGETAAEAVTLCERFIG